MFLIYIDEIFGFGRVDITLINTVDYIMILAGSLFSLYYLFGKAENYPKLSFSQVVQANLGRKRGLKMTFSFLGCLALQYYIGLILLKFLLKRVKWLADANNDTLHLLMPVVVAFIPAYFIPLFTSIIKNIAIQLDSGKNPDIFNPVTRLLYFGHETSYMFWNYCIRLAGARYTAEMLNDTNNEPILNMLFERNKLGLALLSKDEAILKYKYLSNKAHLLVNIFGYQYVVEKTKNKEEKIILHDDFSQADNWSGHERRIRKELADLNRIEEKKYIKSAIREGLPKKPKIPDKYKI